MVFICYLMLIVCFIAFILVTLNLCNNRNDHVKSFDNILFILVLLMLSYIFKDFILNVPIIYLGIIIPVYILGILATIYIVWRLELVEAGNKLKQAKENYLIHNKNNPDTFEEYLTSLCYMEYFSVVMGKVKITHPEISFLVTIGWTWFISLPIYLSKNWLKLFIDSINNHMKRISDRITREITDDISKGINEK